MQKVERATVQSLCRRQETEQKAKDLFALAKARTGPGSGHELGPGSIGLAAICALLASEEYVVLLDYSILPTIDTKLP